MRLLAFIFLTLMLSFAAIASADPQPAAELQQLTLHDVQGLFGGQNIYLNARGQLIIQVVNGRAGFTERRFEAALPAAKLAELNALLKAHDPASIKLPERPGVPDEARPQLTIELQGGQVIMVSKWANDAHPDFDAIYGWLMALVAEQSKTTPTHEGPFDWDWRPDGF